MLLGAALAPAVADLFGISSSITRPLVGVLVKKRAMCQRAPQQLHIGEPQAQARLECVE